MTKIDYSNHMSYDSLKNMRRYHPAWKLLTSPQAPLVATISQQLRRYVDENFLEEERRINEIVKSIELNVIAMREDILKGNFMEIDGICPDVSLSLDRPLFSPNVQIKIADNDIDYGEGFGTDDALYSQVKQ